MDDILAVGGTVLAIIAAPVILLAIAIFVRLTMLFRVRTQENIVVERWGKFTKIAGPGLNWKMPFIDSTSKPVSLRVQQLEVNIESKTKDNVFVTVPVAVQYVIPEAKVYDAYYRLSDPTAQIRSYVFDVVRSALSRLDLDDAFESKDDIASSVEQTLSDQMREYGFEIVNTLVTDISPDQRVRDSMNSINAAQRDRVAAQSLAEADKIKRVTQAEAEAESRRLQGVGVAAQRKAIAEGIAEQYEMLRKVGIENTAEQLLLMTQYFDTMQEVSRNSRSNVLYLPSNPGGVGSMFDEIRNSMLQSNGASAAFEGDSGPAPVAGRQEPSGSSSSTSSTQERIDSTTSAVRDQARSAAERVQKRADSVLSREQQERLKGKAQSFTDRFRGDSS